jgi:hypothetical protein
MWQDTLSPSFELFALLRRRPTDATGESLVAIVSQLQLQLPDAPHAQLSHSTIRIVFSSVFEELGVGMQSMASVRQISARHALEPRTFKPPSSSRSWREHIDSTHANK